MKSQETREIPFGMRDRLGYMFGDFGNDFTFLLSSMFLSLIHISEPTRH